MADIIVIIIILAIVALAIRYIYKSKKSGKACMGCPSYGECQKRNGGRHDGRV